MYSYWVFGRFAILWTLCFICAARALPVVLDVPNNADGTNAGTNNEGVVVNENSVIKDDNPNAGQNVGPIPDSTNAVATTARADTGETANRGDIGGNEDTQANPPNTNVQVTDPSGGSEPITEAATTPPGPVGGPDNEGTGGNTSVAIPGQEADGNPDPNADGGNNNGTDTGSPPTNLTTTVQPPVNDRVDKLRQYLLGRGCPPDHVDQILARRSGPPNGEEAVNTFRGWRRRPGWRRKWNRKHNRTLSRTSLSELKVQYLSKFSYGSPESEESLSSCDYSSYSYSDSYSDSFSDSYSDSYSNSFKKLTRRTKRNAETEEDSENLSGGDGSGTSGGGGSANKSDQSGDDNGNESDNYGSEENQDSESSP